MPDRPGLRPRHVQPRRLADLLASTAGTAGAAGMAGTAGMGGMTGMGGMDGDDMVSGITHDSRQVGPGDLYMALPGATTHGARFAAAALDHGAAAVVTDPAGRALIAAEPSVPVVVVDDPRARMGELAAAVYGHPARDLLMLGVTGTNGKTTTTYLLESGLRAGGHRTGLIGTVGTRIGDERVVSVRTTPEATDVHALLAVMREQGVTACAMEVSSHAMVFGRVDGIVFDVVGFTNLSQDHLDFHAGIEEYFAAKAALFTEDRARRAVVVADDDYGRRLADGASVPTVRLGHDVHGPGWRIVPGADPAMVDAEGKKLDLRVPIPGAFNVTNAALAVAMLVEGGVAARDAVAGVAACPGVPGRMERVRIGDPSVPVALVDFAHTPDAIDNVLRAVQPGRADQTIPAGPSAGPHAGSTGSHRGRLVAVLGAGGDRDRQKRALMGQAATRRADVVVVTDDNPRSEDPASIRAAVLEGARSVAVPGRTEILEVEGRRDAVRAALRVAGGDDVVVVLGKGHEQGQEIAGVVHPFDDRDVLREELQHWSEETSR